MNFDIIDRNEEQFTALELLYIKCPEAVIHILNNSLPTTICNHLSDGKLTLEIDFRTVIGIPQENENEKQERLYTETDLLAKLVHQSKLSSKIILPHVIVKTFLDLKWEKMKSWLYTSIFLHVRKKILCAKFQFTVSFIIHNWKLYT